MSKLVIKDLEKNVELDRKAMRDLRGGVRPMDIAFRIFRASIIEQNKDKKYWKKKLGQLGF